jgi:hypothetical protein
MKGFTKLLVLAALFGGCEKKSEQRVGGSHQAGAIERAVGFAGSKEAILCGRNEDCGNGLRCVRVYEPATRSTHGACVVGCSEAAPCPHGASCVNSPHVGVPDGFTGFCFVLGGGSKD